MISSRTVRAVVQRVVRGVGPRGRRGRGRDRPRPRRAPRRGPGGRRGRRRLPGGQGPEPPGLPRRGGADEPLGARRRRRAPRRLAVHSPRRRAQGAPAVLLGRGAARGGEPALRALRVERLRPSGLPVATGVFRAMMDVALVNQGPVTILLDSRKLF